MAILRGLAAALLLLLSAPLARAQQTFEHDVKAAFLYNFTKFVEWPDAQARAAEPFRMCVLADAEFTRSLDTIIQGETVLGRPLERVSPVTPETVGRCQLLYIHENEREQTVRLLTAVRDLPVLTVGDSPRFLAAGGMIQFVVENNRVRFDIAVKAAERSGLRMSSKLLRVARNVTESRTRK